MYKGKINVNGKEISVTIKGKVTKYMQMRFVTSDGYNLRDIGCFESGADLIYEGTSQIVSVVGVCGSSFIRFAENYIELKRINTNTLEGVVFIDDSCQSYDDETGKPDGWITPYEEVPNPDRFTFGLEFTEDED